MNSFKKILILFLCVPGFLLLVGPTVHAMTPTLSVLATGSGDSVQINVAGDPNESVIFFWQNGLSANFLGTTNSSGSLSTTVSSSAFSGILYNSTVFVRIGGAGTSNPQSNQVLWPYNSTSSASTFSLNQTGIILTAGQSSTVTASNYGTSSLYLLNNSNPSIANIAINGGQINVLGNTGGSTVATICILGSSTNCPSIYITVQNAGASQLSFSQNNISIAPGQNIPITVTEGTGIYSVSNNSNPTVIQANISGSTVNLTTSSTSGSASITICSTDLSSCGILNATATTTGTSTITFSQTNPTVLTGQSTIVTVYGLSGSVFYVSANTNPSIIQANLSNSTLTLTGIASGSSNITICSSTGVCGTLTATVSFASSGGALALSQSSISILSGQTLNVTVSGGYTPYYISTSIDSSIFRASINGNIITVSGVASGSSRFDICSSGGGGCVTLFVIVNGVISPTPVSVPAPVVTATPIITTPSYVFSRYLGFGDKGADVLQLQKTLVTDGFLTATPTGRYGAATKLAVQEYQKSHGIKQTGNFGPATKDSFNQISKVISSTKSQQIDAIQQQVKQLLAQIAQIQGQ